MNTLYDRIKARETDSGEPVEDLCRPLSAKVMPRSAMWAPGGGEMTQTVAIMAQRRTTRPAHPRRKKG